MKRVKADKGRGGADKRPRWKVKEGVRGEKMEARTLSR